MISDRALAIKCLHKCCLKKGRVLPKEAKSEAGEAENESLYQCVEPLDSGSHGVIVRDTTSSELKQRVVSETT